MRWIEPMREEREERRFPRIAVRAALLVVLPSLVPIAADLVRPDGLPLVADTDLSDILVPCPENVKEAAAVALAGLSRRLRDDVRRRPHDGQYCRTHPARVPTAPCTGDAEFKALLAADLQPLRDSATHRRVRRRAHRLGSRLRVRAARTASTASAIRRRLRAGADGRGETPRRLGVDVADLPAVSPASRWSTRFSKNWRRGHVPGSFRSPTAWCREPTTRKPAPAASPAHRSAAPRRARGKGPGRDAGDGGFQACGTSSAVSRRGRRRAGSWNGGGGDQRRGGQGAGAEPDAAASPEGAP